MLMDGRMTPVVFNGRGSLTADNNWTYSSTLSETAAIDTAPRPFAGNALRFGSEADPAAKTALKANLSAPVNVDTISSVTIKAKAVINQPGDDTVINIRSSNGKAVYKLVFNSSRLGSPTVQLYIKGASGSCSIDLGNLGDQLEGIPSRRSMPKTRSVPIATGLA